VLKDLKPHPYYLTVSTKYKQFIHIGLILVEMASFKSDLQIYIW